MIEDSASKGYPISCISGRDRYDCIERVGKKEADIVAVDPEDMYLAAKNKLAEKAGYNVVEQVISDLRYLKIRFLINVIEFIDTHKKFKNIIYKIRKKLS